VSVKGHLKKTNSTGVAKITLPGSGTGKVTVSVTAPTYEELSQFGQAVAPGRLVW
jgi:hypothetical protein